MFDMNSLTLTLDSTKNIEMEIVRDKKIIKDHAN